jgi:hypothetical protein
VATKKEDWCKQCKSSISSCKSINKTTDQPNGCLVAALTPNTLKCTSSTTKSPERATKEMCVCVCLSVSLSLSLSLQLKSQHFLSWVLQLKAPQNFPNRYTTVIRESYLSLSHSLSFCSLLQQIKLSLEENVMYNRGQESNIIYHPRPQTTKKKVFKFLTHMSVMGVCVCVCVFVWKVPIISCECIGCLCICVWEGFV